MIHNVKQTTFQKWFIMWSGASCAVDVLLDIFYFGIYDKTKGLDVPTRDTGMVQRIDAMCQFREVFNTASCELREEIWNWCVTNLPDAYAPKGRGDAEVVAGFASFVTSAKSMVTINTVSTCCVCDTDICNAATIGVTSVSNMSIEKCDGDLAKGIESEVNTQVRNCQKTKCNVHHNADVIEKSVHLSWPNILLVELGVAGHKNHHNPPARIEECMVVGQTMYKLQASVQVQPGHFYCIVKHEEEYAVIDGLKATVSYYDTFSAAVQQSNVPTERFHYTSTNHDAIHILVYQKMSQNTESNTSNEESNISKGTRIFVDDTNNTQSAECHNSPIDSNKHLTTDVKPVVAAKNTTVSSMSDTRCNVPTTKHERSTLHEQLPVDTETGFRNHEQSVDNAGDIDLGLCRVACVRDSGYIFVSCEQTFRYAEMTAHVRKNGYVCIDNVLQRAGLEREKCFTFEGTLRHYIRIDALLIVLRSKIGNHNSKQPMIIHLEKMCPVLTPAHRNPSSRDLYDTRVKQLTDEMKTKGIQLCTGHVLLSTERIRYANKHDVM
ncbi:MAG: hypothetical protein ABW185_25170 [Sedimenticola sp.]